MAYFYKIALKPKKNNIFLLTAFRLCVISMQNTIYGIKAREKRVNFEEEGNMKKFIAVVLVVSALLCAVPVMAADSFATQPNGPSADNIVSINALSYLIGFFNIAYERKIVDFISVRVRAMDWAIINTISNGSGNFYGFGGDIFYYPVGKACTGWFLGPRFDTFFLSTKTDTAEGTWNMMMLGASAGYRWVWEGGFEMGIGFGAWADVKSSYTIKSGADQTSGDLKVLNGVGPTVDYEIGWAF